MIEFTHYFGKYVNMFKIVFKNKVSLEESLKIKNVFIKALKRVEKHVKNKQKQHN